MEERARIYLFSYLTGLLCHGASPAEAKELAQHADVRMTMRYTHIGLDDQAESLASPPHPERARVAGHRMGFGRRSGSAGVAG